MSGDDLTVNCPTCAKLVDYRQRAQNPHFPFCSERCKLIDLGKWFEGEHRIEDPLAERNGDEEQSGPDDNQTTES